MLTSNRAGADIYIDLGTANTLVMTKRRGLVANEPSVVAYFDRGDGRREIVAIGNEAKGKIGRTFGNLVAGFPLKDGVIADLETTQAMLRYFMSRAQSRFQFTKPRVVISLPFGVSDIEKKAVRDVGLAAGAREVILIEEPMAAAIGAGLPVHAPKGNMVIDIGGGTTEIAIISLYGIVHCEAVRIGGHAFDQAIVEHIRRRHNLIVGNQSAEKIKIQIGSALPDVAVESAAIRGVDYTTGLPREITITSDQVYAAMENLISSLCEAGRRALENTPPDLIPDIVNEGVSIAGGGALIRDLDIRLSRELKIPVRVADDPLLAIARGGHRSLCEPELLERIAL